MPNIKINGSAIIVTRAEGDPKRFPNTARGWGGSPVDPDSRVYYWLKPYLEKAVGHRLIKKQMSKDGHMVDDLRQYLRSANAKDPDCVGIVNGSWAIENLAEKWNRDGKFVLTVHLLREGGAC